LAVAKKRPIVLSKSVLEGHRKTQATARWQLCFASPAKANREITTGENDCDVSFDPVKQKRRRGKIKKIHCVDVPRSELVPRDRWPRRMMLSMSSVCPAFDLALQVMTMLGSCNSISAAKLEDGRQQFYWSNDMSWAQLLSRVYPTIHYAGIERADGLAMTISTLRDQITARKLIKIAQLRLIPTEDLADHLRLDPQEGTVKLFHHTSFLKESLIVGGSSTRYV
jgi:hypothetical protein